MSQSEKNLVSVENTIFSAINAIIKSFRTYFFIFFRPRYFTRLVLSGKDSLIIKPLTFLAINCYLFFPSLYAFFFHREVGEKSNEVTLFHLKEVFESLSTFVETLFKIIPIILLGYLIAVLFCYLLFRRESKKVVIMNLFLYLVSIQLLAFFYISFSPYFSDTLKQEFDLGDIALIWIALPAYVMMITTIIIFVLVKELFSERKSMMPTRLAATWIMILVISPYVILKSSGIVFSYLHEISQKTKLAALEVSRPFWQETESDSLGKLTLTLIIRNNEDTDLWFEMDDFSLIADSGYINRKFTVDHWSSLTGTQLVLRPGEDAVAQLSIRDSLLARWLNGLRRDQTPALRVYATYRDMGDNDIKKVESSNFNDAIEGFQ